MKRQFQIAFSVALVLLATIVLSSCTGVTGRVDNPVSPSLTVKVESATIQVGKTVNLGATTVSTSPITYASSDETIATVDANGTVTGVAKGNAIITVSVAATETYAAATKQVAITVEKGIADSSATPLTLEALADAQIRILNPNQLTIKYSINESAKEEFQAYKDIYISKGDKVQFFGNNDSYYANGEWVIIQCFADTYIYGNIMSLIKEEGFENETALTGKYPFFKLFFENKNIKNHPEKDLVLPATQLAKYCYAHMFEGCTGLTRAPELPATTIVNGCYQNMFSQCTSLTKAPKLKATTLTPYCYSDMFSGCSSLTEAWVKAAFKSTDDECSNMFQDAGVTGAKLHTLSANVAGWNNADKMHKGKLTADAGWTD